MTKTRNGKIARLPRNLRNQLNRRLDDAEQGAKLVAWLNRQPRVRQILAENFQGQPISEQNLSEWKAGGYQDWVLQQESLEQARDLAADAGDVSAATDGRLSDHLATVLAARYATLLAKWDGEVTENFTRQVRALRGLAQDIATLRRGDHHVARLHLEEKRLEQHREKTQAEMVDHFKRWIKIPAIKELLSKTCLTQEQKLREYRRIFGMDRAEDSVPSRQQRKEWLKDPTTQDELHPKQMTAEEKMREYRRILGVRDPKERAQPKPDHDELDDGVPIRKEWLAAKAARIAAAKAAKTVSDPIKPKSPADSKQSAPAAPTGSNPIKPKNPAAVAEPAPKPAEDPYPLKNVGFQWGRL